MHNWTVLQEWKKVKKKASSDLGRLTNHRLNKDMLKHFPWHEDYTRREWDARNNGKQNNRQHIVKSKWNVKIVSSTLGSLN